MSSWSKTPSQKDAVHAFLVMKDGVVDVEASCLKFRNAALQLLANSRAEADLITSCISAVFDQYKGARLNASFISSQTAARMSAQVPALANPTLHSMLYKRIAEVLKDLTGEGKEYAIVKGPGGGHYRVADQAK